MKGLFKYIWAIALLLPALSSCHSDEEMTQHGEKEDAMVTFTLNVQSSSATRADDHTWGDNSDEDATNDYPEVAGNDLENKIDISTLYVAAYYDDYSYKADLPILKREIVDGKATFLCALPNFEKGRAYRFVVLANCINKNYGISFKDGMPDLNALVYSNIQNTIPMWGVKRYEIPENVEAGSELDLGPVSLLRAAAKIGVKLGDEVKGEGYRIKELKLNYANSNGFCLPKVNNWHNTNINFTEELKHADSFNPTSRILTENINAMARGSKTDGYYIYVPETVNDATIPLSLAVTLAKENGEEATFDYDEGIKFCYYEEGKPTGESFHIVRNHFYDYTITDINMGLKMNLNVADWKAEDIWELDFSAPVHTNLLTAPNNSAAIPTEEATVAYNNLNDETSAFIGYFKMESPDGASWKPTLANASAGDYEVRVYTNGETTPDIYDIPVTESSIEAVKDRFFKIVVVAKNADRVGKVVKLGISYTASWNDDDNTLLMINEEKGGNSMYYPWTDNNPDDDKDDPDTHWISIKQVSSK